MRSLVQDEGPKTLTTTSGFLYSSTLQAPPVLRGMQCPRGSSFTRSCRWITTFVVGDIDNSSVQMSTGGSGVSTETSRLGLQVSRGRAC